MQMRKAWPLANNPRRVADTLPTQRVAFLDMRAFLELGCSCHNLINQFLMYDV